MPWRFCRGFPRPRRSAWRFPTSRQPGLKDPAADAAVKIAGKLVGREPKAVAAAMQKVVDAKVGGDAGNRAKQLLGQAKAGAK